MNFFKKRNILLILLSASCVVQLIIYKNKQLENVEEEVYNKINQIEKCIDIENKNKRTIYENLKLSEYCINEFGTIR